MRTPFEFKKTHAAVLAAIFAIGLGASSSWGAAIDSALEERLSAMGPSEEVPVIIKLKDRVDVSAFTEKDRPTRRRNLVEALRSKAERTQGPLISALSRAGARRVRSLWITNGIAAQANAGAIMELSKDPSIESITVDSALEAPTPVVGTAAAPEWNISAIRANELWSLGLTGTGVVVANMDTGVDANHPDLRDRWRAGANSWYDPNGEHAAPYDPAGHGTQTMGLMVGGASGGTAIGVAPGASWIAVKIFNDSGVGYLSGIHLGFQWLLDPDGDTATDDAPDIVNNSWGFTNNVNECITEFAADVSALRAAGIAVAFAAGNQGPLPSTSVSPANNSNGFATGAVDQTLAPANFSSRGPSACDGTLFPEISAPGVSVRTSDLTLGGAVADPYRSVSGTSYSVAHVSGLMALLKGASPNSSVAMLEQALMDSAKDPDANGADNNYGNGVIDGMGAYQTLLAMAPVDIDNDGYAADTDCDDNNASVHPGATEVKHDGIDQDCNGYDLTINITKASYTQRRGTLTVEATSKLGGSAKLALSGYGQMKWSALRSVWSITVRYLKASPGSITVTGVEGSESAGVITSSR